MRLSKTASLAALISLEPRILKWQTPITRVHNSNKILNPGLLQSVWVLAELTTERSRGMLPDVTRHVLNVELTAL
jgi:hypothetical protein